MKFGMGPDTNLVLSRFFPGCVPLSTDIQREFQGNTYFVFPELVALMRRVRRVLIAIRPDTVLELTYESWSREGPFVCVESFNTGDINVIEREQHFQAREHVRANMKERLATMRQTRINQIQCANAVRTMVITQHTQELAQIANAANVQITATTQLMMTHLQFTEVRLGVLGRIRRRLANLF